MTNIIEKAKILLTAKCDNREEFETLLNEICPQYEENEE